MSEVFRKSQKIAGTNKRFNNTVSEFLSLFPGAFRQSSGDSRLHLSPNQKLAIVMMRYFSSMPTLYSTKLLDIATHRPIELYITIHFIRVISPYRDPCISLISTQSP